MKTILADNAFRVALVALIAASVVRPEIACAQAAAPSAKLAPEHAVAAKTALRAEVQPAKPQADAAVVRILGAPALELDARALQPSSALPKKRVVTEQAGTATVSVKKGEQVVVQRLPAIAQPVAALSTAKQPLPSTLLVGVSDAQGRASVRQLQPFVVAARVEIAIAGPSGYQRVRLLTKSFHPPVEIKAHSTVGDGVFRRGQGSWSESS